MCRAMASEGKAVCVLDGCVHGQHIYKAMCTPPVGEILAVLQEPGNDNDRHAMCIKRYAEIEGDVPREFSRQLTPIDGSLYHRIGICHTSHNLVFTLAMKEINTYHIQAHALIKRVCNSMYTVISL